MGKRKKNRVDTTANVDASATTSLGSLFANAGFAASAGVAEEESESASVDLGDGLQNLRKAVLRMERKGRGGKTVTVVSQLSVDDARLKRIAQELRRALGVGARVEGSDIVLQGDVRERARTWLLAKGVRRVAG